MIGRFPIGNIEPFFIVEMTGLKSLQHQGEIRYMDNFII